MKRVVLAAISAGLLVPSVALVGNAGAANPHGTPPGQGGDPNASCGGSSGGKPDNCNSANLPFSEGCQNGQAPNQNPHCEGTTTNTPPGGSPGGNNPGGNPGGNNPGLNPTAANPGAGGPAGDVAGAVEQGGAENKLAADAARGGAGGKLPFTGLETLWLLLLGAGMIASGLAVRARSGSSA
jgi:hypothetical protein